MRLQCLLAAAALSLVSATARAVELPSIGQGAYQYPFGFSRPPSRIDIGVQDTSYAGHGIGGLPFRTRGYVVFDLSSVTLPVAAATLTLKLTEYVSTGAIFEKPYPYITPPASNASEAFTLYEVSAPPDALVLPHGNASGNPFSIVINTEGVGFYDDLGEGASLGSFDASASSVGGALTVSLNGGALGLINSHLGGTFALGIRHVGSEFHMGAGLFGFPMADQHIRLDGTDGSQVLSVTSVPEPGGVSLWLAGLAVVGTLRQRTRVSAACGQCREA